MIVANDVAACGAGFCCDTNIIKIIDRDGTILDFPQMPKEQVSEVILDHVVASRKKEGKEQ
jgi:phosphopantothenoylcysteine decarboxylase/phosphopantothenate--cysteine ligase